MNRSSSQTDLSIILAHIEKKLDKIDRTLHPPFWIKLLRWIGRNFFTIILIVVIIFLSYKAWDMYQDLLFRIEEIRNIPTNAINTGKGAIQNVVEQLKFW